MTRHKDSALRPWAAAAALFLLAAAAAAGVLHLNRHLAAPRADSAESKRYYHDVYAPFWKKSADGRRYLPAGEGAKNPAFAAQKPADARRIIIVGGSVAAFFPCETLKTRLERAWPGTRFEVVNSAFPGYDSFRVLRVVKEVLAYSPDILVVISGNNEYYPQALSSRPAAMLRALLGRVPRLRRFAAPREVRPRAARSRARRIADYEKNLRAMLRAADRRAVKTALCTLPVNLRWIPHERDNDNADFVRGLFLAERGRMEDAAESLSLFLKTQPENALGNYHLARCLELAGDPGRARALYARAADLDFCHVRACPESNRAASGICGEGPALLIDAQERFLNMSADRITGADLFIDHCHLTPPAMEAFARLAAGEIIGARKLLLAQLGEPEETAVPQGLDEHEIAQSRDQTRQDRLRGMLRHCLGRDGNCFEPHSISYFNQLYAQAPEPIGEIAAGREKWRSVRAGPGADAERKREFEKCWPQLLWLIGEGFRQAGRTGEAKRHFALAEAEGFDHWRLHLSRALMALASGDRAAAARLFGRAERTAPEGHKRSARIWREAASEILS